MIIKARFCVDKWLCIRKLRICSREFFTLQGCRVIRYGVAMKVLSLILLSTVFLVGGCNDGRVASSGYQVKEPAAMADSNDKRI